MHYLTIFFLTLMTLLSPVQAAPPNLNVEIYTIPGCAGCGMAKSMLEEHGVPYTEISIRGRPDLYAQMKQRAGGNPEDSLSVPRIFINGKHLGGYSELNGSDLDALSGKKKSVPE